MNNEEMTLGEEIDQRGILAGLEEGDFINNIVVLLEIVKADGESVIATSRGELTSWVAEAGMIAIAASDYQ